MLNWGLAGAAYTTCDIGGIRSEKREYFGVQRSGCLFGNNTCACVFGRSNTRDYFALFPTSKVTQLRCCPPPVATSFLLL